MPSYTTIQKLGTSTLCIHLPI